jgi:hypothetical protein
MIAHAPAGIAAFASRLSQKSYFIDPQTHAFQQPVRTIKRKKDGEWVLKESIATLASEYNSVIADCAGESPLNLENLTNESITRISENVLQFQWEKLQEALTELPEKEFLDYTGQELRPVFLVAPYFYLEPDNLPIELQRNAQFLSEARSLLSSRTNWKHQKLFAEIVLSQEVLMNNDDIDSVQKQYRDSPADGYLLWIDDFSEVDATLRALSAYRKFVAGLSETKRPIIVLHGSFLSIALSSPSLGIIAGTGHGIEYGEHRPVVPVGGGVPLSKFYFPRFHKRVDYSPDSVNVLLERDWIRSKHEFFKEVCGCVTCRELIKADVAEGFAEFGQTKLSEKNGRAYPTPRAMDLSRQHYLNTKGAEYHHCKSAANNSAIVGELKDASGISTQIQSHSFDHLQRWVKALQT